MGLTADLKMQEKKKSGLENRAIETTKMKQREKQPVKNIN